MMELESEIQKIKHGLLVDPDEQRRVMRRAQYRIEELEGLLSAAFVAGDAVVRATERHWE